MTVATAARKILTGIGLPRKTRFVRSSMAGLQRLMRPERQMMVP